MVNRYAAPPGLTGTAYSTPPGTRVSLKTTPAAAGGVIEQMRMVFNAPDTIKTEIFIYHTPGADIDLPDIVIPVGFLPSNAALVHAYFLWLWRELENTATTTNYLTNINRIYMKKSTGTWGVDDWICFEITNNPLYVPASERGSGGFFLTQTTDLYVAGQVDVADNITYNVRSKLVTGDTLNCNANYLKLHDVQVGMQLVYKVAL